MADSKPPKLSHHKLTERGYITWKGKRHYIPGNWPADKKSPPPKIWSAYSEKVRELLFPSNRPPTPAPVPLPAEGVVLWQAIDAYLKFVEDRFQANPHEPGNITRAMRELLELYGPIRADRFSPKCLKAVRDLMVSRGRTRQGINKHVNYIRTAFRWMVEEEMVPPSVHQALRMVAPLRRGHTTAPESIRKGLVDEETVKATLPHLPRQVAALVQLGLYCGARPSELCRITTGAIDRTDPNVWFFLPPSHKTAHRNHLTERSRQIPLGPKCQEILRPWLREDDPDRFLFSPADSMVEKRATLRLSRKTKVQPSQWDRSKPNPKRGPRDRYDTGSFGRAILEACKRHGIAPWSPGQLRKACAQRILKVVGIEPARAALGHTEQTITRNHYLITERSLAKEAALATG